jgi:anti-sigma B factor antagonist
MSTRDVSPGSPGFSVRWLGRFAVVRAPANPLFLTAAALVGELCAVLEAGAPGLIVELPGTRVYDSTRLSALMRAARRARGWGTWLRLVIPDAGVRQVAQLVALDEVMPVHATVSAAVGAAILESVAVDAGGD